MNENITSFNNHSTVKDLMIPTPMKLKYIPVLKFTSHSFLKKRTISDKTYLGFEIVIIQNLLFLKK
jgi:hypothetical protein